MRKPSFCTFCAEKFLFSVLLNCFLVGDIYCCTKLSTDTVMYMGWREDFSSTVVSALCQETAFWFLTGDFSECRHVTINNCSEALHPQAFS